jgi:hypothetical protein
VAELKNELSWSKSRSKQFNDCKRQYYYHYYKSWGGWNTNASPETKEIYIMKKLSSRAMWIGSVVHSIVGYFIIKNLNIGYKISINDAVNVLRSRMEKEWKNSENGKYRNNPSKVIGLLEHYYSLSTSSSDFDADFENAKSFIENFYNLPIYQHLEKHCPFREPDIENLQKFYLDNIPVWVKVDMAHRVDNSLEIIDWKTGKDHNTEDNQLQLVIYSMYGSEKWNVNISDVILREVNLRLSLDDSWIPDLQKINSATNHIKDSFDEMCNFLVDKDQNIPLDEEHFPLNDNNWMCGWCNFMGACRKTSYYVDDVDNDFSYL